MSFSALQRAEIAEMYADLARRDARRRGFSALQRAEIAEISSFRCSRRRGVQVSVLFNEPKLLKYLVLDDERGAYGGFSALQRAEIAEIVEQNYGIGEPSRFQCSSTSRNC